MHGVAEGDWRRLTFIIDRLRFHFLNLSHFDVFSYLDVFVARCLSYLSCEAELTESDIAFVINEDAGGPQVSVQQA